MITLYRGIVKGRQRQLKTEGTGIWFSTSLDVAKTYSNTVEVWQLDDTLPLQAVQINCNGKSWNEVNTDALARKYSNKDVVLFKDVVDVGSNWLDQLPDEAKSSKESAHSVLKKYFTANDWVVNNANCINRLRVINFKENKQMNKLFENILQEASKKRFIDKVYYDITANPRRCELFLSHTKSAGKHMPGREALVKWVDSGAADKYKIDWNTILKSTPDNPGEFGRLVDAYYDYEDNNEKIKRTNPILVFKNSGLNYNTESNPDFLYLGESDKFLFIGVCTYNAAVFCDSFKCGGAGAQWCIGTKDNNGYWYDYYYESNTFVIAYNKTTFGDGEKQKYMLQLYRESDETRATVWNQPDDDIIRCVGMEDWDNFSNIFGIGKEDCERFFNKLFEIVGYKGEDILNVMKIIAYDYKYKAKPQRVIQLSDIDVPSFNYSILARNIEGLNLARVLEYNALEKEDLYYDNIILGPETIGEYNALNRMNQYPAITFNGCGNIYIKDLWASTYPIGLSFVDCDKITIDTIHLPAYNFLLDWVSKNGTDGITTILKDDLDLSLPNCEIKNIIFSPSADFCSNYPEYVFSTILDLDYDLPVLISLSEIQNGIQMDVSKAKQSITIDFRNELSLFKSDKFDISNVIKNVTRNTPVIRAINVPESKRVYWSEQSLYPDISFNVFTVPEHK